MKRFMHCPVAAQSPAPSGSVRLRITLLAFLLAAGALFCVGAQGQAATSGGAASTAAPQQAKEAKSAPTAPAKHKLGPLEISINWRVRAEGWDWFDSGAGENVYAFPHSLLHVGIGQTGRRFDWQLEASQDMILGLPAGAVKPAPQGQLGLGGAYYAASGNSANNVNGFVKQAYVRVKNLGNGNLRFGRFEFLDGAEVKPKDPTLATLAQTRIAQRLIGNFGWSAVQRSFDGVQIGYNFNQNNFTFLAARPTRGVFQIDGMGELDVDLYYGALTAPVQTARGAGELRVFAAGYIDHRSRVLKTDNRPQAARAADHGLIEIGTYGADYIHVFNTAASGKFNLLAWGAFQTGSWGRLTQRAAAFVGEAGWQPPVKSVKPWLSAGFSWGSGDGNPNDSTHGTFFQILPTPRPYARFPFFNMQNNQDSYGTLGLRPHPKISLRSEIHALRLDQAADLWYLGGGAFQPRTFGYVGRPSNAHRGLADVWDISADTQVTRDFSVGLYYGHAWGKGVIAAIYPKNSSGQLAYVETNFNF